MELRDIYVGRPVKSKTVEGFFIILRIDDYTQSVWAESINSIDLDLREFEIKDLIAL
jgi:hypothetical protein